MHTTYAHATCTRKHEGRHKSCSSNEKYNSPPFFSSFFSEDSPYLPRCNGDHALDSERTKWPRWVGQQWEVIEAQGIVKRNHWQRVRGRQRGPNPRWVDPFVGRKFHQASVARGALRSLSAVHICQGKQMGRRRGSIVNGTVPASLVSVGGVVMRRWIRDTWRKGTSGRRILCV